MPPGPSRLVQLQDGPRRRSRRHGAGTKNRVSCGTGGGHGNVDGFFLTAPSIASVQPVGKVTAGDSTIPAPFVASQRSGLLAGRKQHGRLHPSAHGSRQVGLRSGALSGRHNFPLLEEEEEEEEEREEKKEERPQQGQHPRSQLDDELEGVTDSMGGEFGGGGLTVLEFCLQSAARQAEERRQADAFAYGDVGLWAGGEWETAQTPDGRAYYVNHVTRETSWDPPDMSS